MDEVGIMSEVAVGFASADITPDFPVELIGGAWENPVTTAVQSPLSLHIVVFVGAGQSCALVTVDSLGFTPQLTYGLQESVAQVVGTVPQQVMVNFSHVHSAPFPFSPVGGQRYLDLVYQRAAEAATAAIDAGVPCHAAWGLGRTTIAENRREDAVAVDDRIGVVRFVSIATGQSIAQVLRIAAHANILMTGEAVISSDFIGAARSRIAEETGIPTMIMQGAAGNLKPAGTDTVRGGTVQDVQRVAAQLADDFGGVAFGEERPLAVEMGQQTITLVAEIPSADEAAAIADQAQERFGIDGTAWLDECARLRDSGVREQSHERPLRFLQVNEGTLCGLSDELFCEIAMEAAERRETDLFFLNGYTGGCTVYLPTVTEWDRGGYEVLYSLLIFFPFYGQVMPFRRSSAEEILTAVAGTPVRQSP